MPWARHDEHADDNPKLVALSSDAFRLWWQSTIYCQRHLTNGFITEAALVGLRYYRPELRTELVSVLVPGKGPLWHEVEGGIKLHDYLRWNDSKTKVLKRRKQTRTRVRKFRQKLQGVGVNASLCNGVTNAHRNAQTLHSTSQMEKLKNTGATRRPLYTTLQQVPFKHYVAIAHQALDQEHADAYTANVADAFKTICARAHLAYDSEITRKAIEAAEHARAKKVFA